jgi:hypothetical protein
MTIALLRKALPARSAGAILAVWAVIGFHVSGGTAQEAAT